VASGGPGQPWPVGRTDHSAVSLYDSDTNPSNPTLMVMWGSDGNEVLNDWWLFEVNAQHWRKVRQCVSSISFSTEQTIAVCYQTYYLHVYTVMSSSYRLH